MRSYIIYKSSGWALIALIVVAIGALCGCAKVDEDNSTQQSKIVSYLEGSHSPALIAESELDDAIDTDPPFYTTYGDYAYRYIATYYDEGREEMAEIVNGSRVTLTFEIYSTMTGLVNSGALPEYTNNSYYESYYIDMGLNTEYWDFTPLTITVGSDHILATLNEGLLGCRANDLIEFYLTRNMAYGDNVIGLVDKGSALLVACFIESVEN